jgi:hypothetical protein
MGVCLVKADTLNIYINPRQDVRILSIGKDDATRGRLNQSSGTVRQNDGDLYAAAGNRRSRPAKRTTRLEKGSLIDIHA